MRKILLTGGIWLFAIFSLYAQQRPSYSQYFLNAHTINPAITGVEDYTDVKMGYRRQWVGMDNAPKSYFLSISSTIAQKKITFPYQDNALRISNPDIYEKLKEQEEYNQRTSSKHGLGGYIMGSEMSIFKHVEGALTYAYNISITEKLRLSAGVAVGLSNMRLSPEDLKLRENQDELYQAYLQQNGAVTQLDASVGTFLYAPGFYIGYSAVQLAQNSIISDNVSQAQENVQHYIMAGKRFILNSQLELLPSALINVASGSAPRMDFNLKVRYNRSLWAGITYRNTNTIAGTVGLTVNDLLNIGYAYDYASEPFNEINNGTHEVVLGLMLFNKKNASPYLW